MNEFTEVLHVRFTLLIATKTEHSTLNFQACRSLKTGSCEYMGPITMGIN